MLGTGADIEEAVIAISQMHVGNLQKLLCLYYFISE